SPQTPPGVRPAPEAKGRCLVGCPAFFKRDRFGKCESMRGPLLAGQQWGGVGSGPSQPAWPIGPLRRKLSFDIGTAVIRTAVAAKSSTIRQSPKYFARTPV